MNNKAVIRSLKKILKEVNKIQRAVETNIIKKEKNMIPKTSSYIECNDEYIQKIADQLEDKYHSIKNDLGYEFLRYRDIRLIKTLDTPNNYLIINSEQELNRSENNININ